MNYCNNNYFVKWKEYIEAKETCGPFYQHGVTLIPAWISDYMLRNVCDEIAYPSLNFNGFTVWRLGVDK